VDHGANPYAENVRMSNVENVYAKSESPGMSENDSLTDLLKQLRQRAGLSMDKLAKAIGLAGGSSYQRYENPALYPKEELPVPLTKALAKALAGKGSPPITSEEVMKLAGIDKLSTAQLLSMEEQSVVWCTGEVAAGVWREAFEWPRDEWIPFPMLLLDTRYPDAERRALRVRGDSMDRFYPDGSYVVYVRLADIGRKPQNGDRVVVLRHRHGMTEATIKEYRRDASKKTWLVPHSHNPAHTAQALAKPSDDDETTEIMGLIVGSQRLE